MLKTKVLFFGIFFTAVSATKNAQCTLKPIDNKSKLKGTVKATQENDKSKVKMEVEITDISTTKPFGLRPMDVKECTAAQLVFGKKKDDITVAKEKKTHELTPTKFGLFSTSAFNVVGKTLAVTENSADTTKLGTLIGCCVMENSAGNLGHNFALVTLSMVAWFLTQY